MGLGTGELLLLIFVVAVVFSASRMGALGNALGQFVHSFRKASRGSGYLHTSARKDPPQNAEWLQRSDRQHPSR